MLPLQDVSLRFCRRRVLALQGLLTDQSLTACTSCGTLTCGDCIDFMKTALKNNEDGHRCPTCEDRASEEGGWRMKMVIDRMRRTGEVPLTESEFEHMLQ